MKMNESKLSVVVEFFEFMDRLGYNTVRQYNLPWHEIKTKIVLLFNFYSLVRHLNLNEVEYYATNEQNIFGIDRDIENLEGIKTFFNRNNLNQTSTPDKSDFDQYVQYLEGVYNKCLQIYKSESFAHNWMDKYNSSFNQLIESHFKLDTILENKVFAIYIKHFQVLNNKYSKNRLRWLVSSILFALLILIFAFFKIYNFESINQDIFTNNFRFMFYVLLHISMSVILIFGIFFSVKNYQNYSNMIYKNDQIIAALNTFELISALSNLEKTTKDSMIKGIVSMIYTIHPTGFIKYSKDYNPLLPAEIPDVNAKFKIAGLEIASSKQ
jgi:hypothetical protein